MKSIKISVDVMGGDHGLPVTLPACVKAVAKNNDLTLVLVGDEDLINRNLDLMSIDASVKKRLIVQHASEVVTMDELPSSALRTKKDSSMRVAINLVKEEAVQACVSAGNTGALMATAKFVLKTLPGIDRPAIVAELPTFNGITRAMDLGANVDSCAEHLFQFAVMGSALIKALDKKARPSIGLLNIGVEEVKGNDQVKRTAHMLSQCSLINYVGYVEGDSFYSGVVDLVICDGFVGNTALKASEGIAKLMLRVLKFSFQKNIVTKIIGLLSRPILSILKEKLDPARYNGASMLGLNGIVIKSHGSADEHAFGFAIDQAILQVKNCVVDLVRDQITAFMDQGLLL